MAFPQALTQIVRHTLAAPRTVLSLLHEGTHSLVKGGTCVVPGSRNFSLGVLTPSSLRSGSSSIPRMRPRLQVSQMRTFKILSAAEDDGRAQTEQKSKESQAVQKRNGELQAVQKRQEETRPARAGSGGGTAALSPLSSVIEDLWDPMFPSRFMSPTRSIARMVDAMDRIFDDFSFTPSTFARDNLAGRTQLRSPFEVQEDDDGYHIRIDMPGLSKEEVKVQIEDDVLSIKGEHSEEKKADKRFSRTFGTYQTRLALPDDTDPEGVSAELKDGVLLVTLQKNPEKAKEKVIDVQIK